MLKMAKAVAGYSVPRRRAEINGQQKRDILPKDTAGSGSHLAKKSSLSKYKHKGKGDNCVFFINRIITRGGDARHNCTQESSGFRVRPVYVSIKSLLMPPTSARWPLILSCLCTTSEIIQRLGCGCVFLYLLSSLKVMRIISSNGKSYYQY